MKNEALTDRRPTSPAGTALLEQVAITPARARFCKQVAKSSGNNSLENSHNHAGAPIPPVTENWPILSRHLALTGPNVTPQQRSWHMAQAISTPITRRRAIAGLALIS